MSRYELNLPDPNNLIHALRDIGYTLETALADIIDNSITAKASEVHIYFSFDLHNSYISIFDNGIGMNEDELKNAMKLGSFDPILSRKQEDLGRFGLGLKTASFSQVSKLTVISKQENEVHGRCWDLDHVAKTRKWEVLLYDDDQIQKIPRIEKLDKNGTLVLWEKLDRLIDTTGKRNPEEIFLEKIDDAREHLGLVFHRYLSGEAGLKKLSIFINEDPILPFDPFEGAGKHFPEETIGKIKIQAYLLPHQSKTTVEQYKKLAGKDGYMKSQGFYVYRNARLMIHGTWFRLVKQTEATKLARVKIDLPNSEDFSWSIDVKKSRATPPEAIRAEFKRTIDHITSSSTRVYKNRGARISKKDYVPVWTEQHMHNEKSYRINYENPLINSLLTSLDIETENKVKEILSLVESTLPLDSIFADLATEPESVKQDSVSEEQIKDYAEQYWNIMSAMGNGFDAIAEKFVQTEPFSRFAGFCESFIKTKGDIYGNN